MSYADVVEPWHDFYVTAGAAAATLVGLLFVGLSLHIRIVAEHPEVRGLARVTLADFFVVLLISLAMLAPLGDISAATWLIAVGLMTLALIARPGVESLRHMRARTIDSRMVTARFGVSTLACLALVGTGVLFGSGRVNDGLYALATISVVLLVIAVRNTWDLLVTVALRRER